MHISSKDSLTLEVEHSVDMPSSGCVRSTGPTLQVGVVLWPGMAYLTISSSFMRYLGLKIEKYKKMTRM